MGRDVTIDMLQSVCAELAGDDGVSSAMRPSNAYPPSFEALGLGPKPAWLLDGSWARGLGCDLIGGPPPETADEIAKLTTALQLLSPDTPRGNGSFFYGDGSPNPDHWLAVVWAIASLGWESGKEIARDWSIGCPARYTEDGFEAAWNSFKADHPNRIGIGSLYMRVKELGWQPPERAAPMEATQHGRYKLLGGADIKSWPPMVWRIKGIFPATGLAALYGPSGSGKSFLALDMACAIAEGQKWFEFRTHATTVVYVALEGEAGYRSRVMAWEQNRGGDLPPNLKMVIQPFKLTAPQDVADLGVTVPKDSVIFIDTLNRAAPTSDENSSSDMGEILEGAKRLQQITGGLVVLVHHTGKDQSRGARGHSSLFAALDGAVSVDRTAFGLRSWSVAKSKDGEDGLKFSFKLKQHQLGKDADGDDITSCTVERDFTNVFLRPEPQGKDQKAAFRLIKTKLNSSPNKGKARCSHPDPCITIDQAIASVADSLVTYESNKRKNRARKIVDDLIKGGHFDSGLEGDAGWLWLAP